MRKNKQAFTLIELLVVVLIIGILATSALPQYKKAALKSRNAELKQLIKTVYQAEKAYYMANGKYAANFNELDIDLPLIPVGTTEGSTSGICKTYVQGTDSVRQGKDFYIALNNSDSHSKMSWVSVVAYWDNGPYQCAGFGISQNTGLICKEHKNTLRYVANAGEFCEKIENGTHNTDKSTVSWRSYDLP